MENTHMPAPVSVPSHAQKSTVNVNAQFPGSSTTDDLLIALRKGKRSCTRHPLSNFISYSHLSSFFHSSISSLDSY